ncbi:MAG TPA: Asp-tRNA(Asn)/Glu-tRNA(Gln) amidotransferase subunit GatC [Candidatus Dorea intestinavium]|nr:Asp-tRNA(Asn)/Glu-tRNA(Gln) amidotransferase subunit GatC [Candidatus Dorea intestinavium]
MLKTISDELIKHLYELSQLQYEKDEAKEIKAELEEMLNYFAVLDEIDTSNMVEETKEEREESFPFRKDLASGNNGQEAALLNAPRKEDDYVIVPKTIK